MIIYIYIHTHTYIHTYIYTYIHTHKYQTLVSNMINFKIWYWMRCIFKRAWQVAKIALQYRVKDWQCRGQFIDIHIFNRAFDSQKNSAFWLNYKHLNFIMPFFHVIHVLSQMDRNSLNNCYCLKGIEQGVCVWGEGGGVGRIRREEICGVFPSLCWLEVLHLNQC